MTERIKRIGIIAIVLFMGFIFYGCGGGSLGEDNATTTNNSIVPSPTPEPVSEVDNITISIPSRVVTTSNPVTGVEPITVRLTDQNGIALQKSVEISTDLGELRDSNGNLSKDVKVMTNEYGEANIEFVAGSVPGKATITILTDKAEKQVNLDIVKIGTISITADKQYVSKDGTVLFNITVKDIYDKPVPGVKVELYSSDNSSLIMGSNFVVTDDNGTAKIYASSKDVDENKTVKITAQSGDKYGSATVNILVPSRIVLSVSPTSVQTGGETVTLQALVTDENNNPTPDVTVNFTSSLGVISNNSINTDSHGVAVTYLTTENESGVATVTASIGNGDLSSSAKLYIIKSSVVNVPAAIEVDNLTASKIYVQGSGEKETDLIRFKVVDGNGNPVKDVRIQFSLVGGSQGGEYLVPTDAITNNDGIVSTTLKSGYKPGVVKIKAWYNDKVECETQSITILSGPPEGMHLSLAPKQLNIIGLKENGVEDNITAMLADLYSNPVPNNTSVHFESEYAKIEGADTTTASGDASATLYTQDPRPSNGAPVHVWVQTQTGEYGYISSVYAADDERVYAATDGGGLFRTDNNGQDWDNVGKPRSYEENLKGLWGTYINSMDVSPNDKNFIVVATENYGVMYSNDGGYNWVDLNSRSDRYADSVNISSSGGCATLTYTPINLRERISVKNSSGSDYASWYISGKRFCAKDAGTYTVEYDISYNMPPGAAKIVKLANDTTLFAYFVGYGVYKFDKTALQWSSFNNGLPTSNVSTISLVDSNNDGSYDDIYVTVGGQVYRSSISSSNFVKVGDYQPVVFNDSYVDGTDIYYATTEGVKKFDTTTNSWTDVNFNGCPTNDIKHIVVDKNSKTVYIGTDVGAYRIQDKIAYPLNVYREVINESSDTDTITLKYASDMDKTHTTIYVNGSELPSTYYDFENDKTIKLVEGVDNITKGSIVDVRYTLEPYDSTSYASAPNKKITSMFFKDGSLFIGCDDRKLYRIDNPSVASDSEKPKIVDISGLTSKITHDIYRTTQVMFTGSVKITAFWKLDNETFYRRWNGETVEIPDNRTANFEILVTDRNGRPIPVTYYNGNPITHVYIGGGTFVWWPEESYSIPDTLYGGYGITEFFKDIPNPGYSDAGNLHIEVYNSADGDGQPDHTLSIPIKALQ